MNQSEQAKKAEIFLSQHKAKKMLILPNCWDPLSARMLEVMGFPSVATASVATALVNGYADGEQIPFHALITHIQQICASVNVPVSIDFENGFTNDLPRLKQNIEALLDTGAVGINIEDSAPGTRVITDIDEQCRKIDLIRETALKKRVPLVINARTDLFLHHLPSEQLLETAIDRIKRFAAAGADCAYPIFIKDYEFIAALVKETGVPLNILLLKEVNDMHKLAEIGVARVSVGPGLLKAALTKMKNAAEGLMNHESAEFFSDEFISNDVLKALVHQ